MSEISPKVAQAVLSYAIASGWLSEEQVNLAIAKHPTSEMMRIASWFHQVSCKEDHLESKCHFLEEELTAVGEFRPEFERWSLPTHVFWLQRTTKCMELLGVTNETEFANLFAKTRVLLDYLNHAKETNPLSYALLLLIRGWED